MYQFDVLKSPLDSRDLIVESIYTEKISLPSKLNLWRKLENVRDQGQQGSCSAHAAAAMKEWQEKLDVNFTGYMSPQFIYNNRANQDKEGMTPRDTMKILQKIGCVSEKDYRYGLIQKPTEISPSLYEEAKKYVIAGYAQVNTLEGLKKSLYTSGPCYATFPVYDTERWDFWKPAQQGQEAIGGHACFTKDTKVSLLDGNELSFEELEQKYKNDFFWVYSSDENGNIVPGKAHSSRITQKNAKIIKITLDNGEIIKCTENHQFMLKDGSYKEAKDLEITDSLKPLYRRYTTGKFKGYEQLLNNNTNKWEYTHIISENYYYNSIKTNKDVIHHKNFNKRDNTPENLKLMDKNEHIKLHAGLTYGLNEWVKSDQGRKFLSEHAKKMWKENVNFKEKTLKTLHNNGYITSNKYNYNERNPLDIWRENNYDEFIKTCIEYGNKNYKYMNTKEAKEKAGKTRKEHLNNDKDFKNKMDNISRINIKEYNNYLKNKNWSDNERNDMKIKGIYANFKRWKYDEKYSSFDLYLKEKKGLIINDEGILVPYNHKIINIEFFGYEDVYDITVEHYHNFALSSGVFVHNCTITGWDKDGFIIRNSWSSSWNGTGWTLYPYKHFGMHWEIWTTIDDNSGEPAGERDLKKIQKFFKKIYKKVI